MDQCLNWIRKELFEESEFQVIFGVKMCDVEWRCFDRICGCFIRCMGSRLILRGVFDSG